MKRIPTNEAIKMHEIMNCYNSDKFDKTIQMTECTEVKTNKF